MHFVILGFAIWRVSSLFVQEDGPYFIFERFRHAIGMQWDEYGNPYGETLLTGIFSCVWCLSLWVSFVFFFLYWLFGQYFVWVCFPFALSGFACLVQGVASK